jgi:hypothetical protein
LQLGKVMVSRNMSNQVDISALSEEDGVSGYAKAVEWSVIHPKGPHMAVIV